MKKLTDRYVAAMEKAIAIAREFTSPENIVFAPRISENCKKIYRVNEDGTIDTSPPVPKNPRRKKAEKKSA